MLPTTSLARRRTSIPSKAPVLLVVPPSIFLLDERVFMSLGILKVAAVLERAGFSLEMLDLAGIANYVEALDVHLSRTTAMIVGITATTPQLPAVTKIVERIRERRPDMKVVCGGPHVTLVCAAVKLEVKAGRVGRAHRALEQLKAMFDVIVPGDGEMAVFEALQEGAPKIIDGDEPKGGLFMTNSDYDATPWPARHLVDVDSYHYAIEGHRAVSVIAQLGCPFGCGFCGGRSSKMLRKIRTRTTESIVREIEHLHARYGFTGFQFYDDELNVSKSVVELMNALADLQSRLGVEFRLRGFIKAELFSDEQAEVMRRAGFRWLLCGFEAAAPRILDNINKGATLEENTRVMEIAARHGLKVKALMSVGHPGETEQSILAVADWLIRVRVDDFDCASITVYPGTPYYDESLPHESLPNVWTYTCKRSGDRLHSLDVDYTRVADYYKGDPNGGYKSFVFTDFLTSEQIVSLRDGLEREVRQKLGIPFYPATPAQRFEHSMGQHGGELSPFVLRTTA
jgi:radical SAM superfamily enzyme YgiQ (UPF0313 family)